MIKKTPHLDQTLTSMFQNQGCKGLTELTAVEEGEETATSSAASFDVCQPISLLVELVRVLDRTTRLLDVFAPLVDQYILLAATPTPLE